MRTLLFLLSTAIAASSAYAQNMLRYRALADSAFRLYEAEAYAASAAAYSAAFGELGGKGQMHDRYNAACSWALADGVDSAYTQLWVIADRMDYAELAHITTDSDLNTLHADPRWQPLIARVSANKEKLEAHYDKPLVALLDSLHAKDQDLRLQSADLEARYGRESTEMRAHWKRIRTTDSLNQTLVTRILDERGWLGPEVVGPRGASTLFLVIQHADLPVQQKYLPMMREAVKQGKASGSSLALLEDRVRMRQGLPQRYGSQVGRDAATGAYFLVALEDPDKVDELRAEVGLQPLADYLLNWNMIWDPEAHKRDLPELIKKLAMFKQ